jgi:outer membrane protein insertion porin family
LKQGKRFRDEALKQDTRFVEDAFRSLGYAYSNANYNLSFKPEELTTGIRYSVQPGPVSVILEKPAFQATKTFLKILSENS